jgi:hypothetical protein
MLIERRRAMRDPDSTDGEPDWSFMDGRWTSMLPEIIPATVLLIVSPVWFVGLLRQGSRAPAIGLAIGVVASCAIVAVAFRRRSPRLVHVAVLALLATGAATFGLLGQ